MKNKNQMKIKLKTKGQKCNILKYRYMQTRLKPWDYMDIFPLKLLYYQHEHDLIICRWERN